MRDKLFDITPGWVYRTGKWVKDRPKSIKWWLQRANGTLPRCDLWSYKYTLLDNLRQGINYMLSDDCQIDYTSDRHHRKLRKDLEFIKQWIEDTDWYFIKHYAVVAETDEEILLATSSQSILTDRGEQGYYIQYVTQEWMADYEKRQKKAFKLLGEHFWELWD